MTVSSKNNSEQLRDFFGKRISTLSDDSQAIYRRAFQSFDNFLYAHHLDISDLSQDIVTDWAAQLLRNGSAFQSMVQHIDVVSSLINAASREGLIPDTDVLKSAKAAIIASKAHPGIGNDPAPLRRLLALLRMSRVTLGDDEKYRDILLLSLLNGAMPLMKVAVLKKTDQDTFDDNSRLIFDRNVSRSRRQYVFDLNQAGLTPNQLKRDVYDNILLLVNRHVDPAIKNLDDALYSFWVLLALTCGARCSIALGCVPQHIDRYQPGFVTRIKAAESVRHGLIEAIGPVVVNDPPRWYAMRIRRNVSYDDLKAAIQATSTNLPDIELFYPSEAIASKVGQKIVYQNQPFIRDIVFFKSRATDIAPLFQNIGDKAWCYRVSNTPGAPYAAISKAEFAEFQRAIGHFTDGTEILPLSAATPMPGEDVVIIGSMWGERKGKFDKSFTDKTGKLLYRIVLSPDSGFAFRIDIDPRSVKQKLPE